jgi:hypothetical protein
LAYGIRFYTTHLEQVWSAALRKKWVTERRGCLVLFVSALPPHASAQQSNDGKGKSNRIPPGDQRFGRPIAHDRHPSTFTTVILELRFLGSLWFDGCLGKCITSPCIKGTGIPDLMLMRRRSQNPYPPNNKQSIQERRSTICKAGCVRGIHCATRSRIPPARSLRLPAATTVAGTIC